MAAHFATRRLSGDAAGIAEAARLIAEGQLVAFPTETVYGLGGDAGNPRAVAAIYAAKGRPEFNPLIAHVASRDAAFALGLFSPAAIELAEAFWPGPMTLVVPARAEAPVSDLARAGLASIALRVPEHPVARDLLIAARRPIVAPSANRSGHVSPTTADHVMADLDGMIAAVIDGGAVEIGLESTILACLDDEVTMLRPGGLAREAIEAVTGKPLTHAASEAGNKPIAPGRLASHYAPRAEMRLDATMNAPGEAVLGFGPEPAGAAGAAAFLNLSERGDLAEAAANLYAHLRALDATGVRMIAVRPIPANGLGEAIRDRLTRAAAPRPDNA